LKRYSISIIVLNWNRARLLKICLDSIFETTGHINIEVHVIDNASSDESGSVIQSFGSLVIPHYKNENRGAEWINDIFYSLTTELVYIIANDKKLLDGWMDYAIHAFSAFDDLGQLALHAPAPLDNEVWITKQATYMYREGVGVYDTALNTGLSSLIRRSAAIKSNARFYNIATDGPYKLPDDGLFSSTIRQNGFKSAWSDRYYCLNLGHTRDEFMLEWDYYLKNYESKPWLRVDGLLARIEEHDRMPKPKRYSQIVNMNSIPECRSFPGLPPARVWSTFGGGCPGVEAVEFIHSFIRLVKPSETFVCRSWTGEILLATCEAHFLNDFGKVSYFEPDKHCMDKTENALTQKDSFTPFRVESCIVPPSAQLAVFCGYSEDLNKNCLSQIFKSISENIKYLIIDDNFFKYYDAYENIHRKTEFVSVMLDCPNRLRVFVRVN
jgi:hypothetical protein